MDGNQVHGEPFDPSSFYKNRIVTIAEFQSLLLNFYLFLAKRAKPFWWRVSIFVWLQNLKTFGNKIINFLILFEPSFLGDDGDQSHLQFRLPPPARSV